MTRALPVLAGIGLLLALDALVIVAARLLDPGAPIIYISNLVATFIGAVQLLWGLPIVLILRRRGPSRRLLAAGVSVGMALVLVLNVIALYR
jgi:hypothetical protein